MLQLLNPIGLLAATAVLIPILVHLWRERKGKTLRIGSITLLGNNNRSRSSSLRIFNWPLFLLRCLLLLLLACILAQPVWQQAPVANGPKGWILIPKAERRIAYQHYQSQIDSLLAANWELHDLFTGFKKFAIGDAGDSLATGPVGTAPSLSRHSPDPIQTLSTEPWRMLRELETVLPAGYPVQVFTSNQVVQYQGSRPSSTFDIGWHSYPLADSLRHDALAAWIAPDQSLRTLDEITTPAGNRYVGTTPATVSGHVDTSVLRITICPGSNPADARYLLAALRAIGEVNGRRMQLTTLAPGQTVAVPQHLIFLLDTIPAPPLATLADGGSLFRYDTGRIRPFASWQQAASLASGNGLHNRVYRYAVGEPVGRPVWTLANGQELLTVQDTAARQVYHFKGRFNPASTDMVWEDGFVQQLLPLILPAPDRSALVDLRSIDDRQAIPARSTAPRPVNIATTFPMTDTSTGTDLIPWIGLLSLLVFAVERILVYQQQKNTRHA